MSRLTAPNSTQAISGEWYKYFLDLNNFSGLSGSSFKLWGEVSIGGLETYFDGTTPPSTAAIASPIIAASFVNAVTDTVHGQLILPANTLKGGNWIPFVRWAPSSTNTGDCYWRLQYSLASKGTAFPAAATDNIQVAGGGTANAPQNDEFTELASPHAAGDPYNAGDPFIFTLSRIGGDAADTFTGDAFLLSVGLFYRIAAQGKQDRTDL